MDVQEEEGGNLSEGTISGFANQSSPISSSDPCIHHSPPLPPPDFNPPAEYPSDSPAHTVSDPGSSVTSPSTSNGGFYNSLDALAAPSSIDHLVSSRPDLRALQRASNESITYSAGSGASSTSSFSGESGDHLVEMRDRLRWETSTGGSRSRSNSVSTVEAFRVNFIHPTPPSEAVDEMGDAEALAGPSHGRRLSSNALESLDEASDLPIEHAWDSVWPASGSAHRPIASDFSGPSRFPTAPVSPFITPAFSPAIIPINSRKPLSPVLNPHDATSPIKRSHSPPNSYRFSPGGGSTSPNQDTLNFSFGSSEAMFMRRRSVTSDAPLLAHSPPTTAPITISKHHRTFSNSSQNSPQGRLTFERLQKTSSIAYSPPKSPGHAMSDFAPPASPAFGKHAKSNLGTGDFLKSMRTANSDASPPISAVSLGKGRPRGRSLSSAQNIRDPLPYIGKLSPLPPPAFSSQERDNSTFSFPPIALPPPVAPPELAPLDDTSRLEASTSMSPPLFAPLARPGVLRRALSDYDGKTRPETSAFLRTLSFTSDLDKSPKRDVESADLHSPTSPGASGDQDTTRTKKSPKKSPQQPPKLSPMSQNPGNMLNDDTSGDYPGAAALTKPQLPPEGMSMGDVELMDEGDVLPTNEIHMDVTFDDEGLNTLERIFLLSKSEYPFHRSYVARVLGDLLNDVDPCESVEYVLPLLSGFSMDEDESVKEAFASELHRILWYFYSTCKLVMEDGEVEEVEGAGPRVDVHSPSPGHQDVASHQDLSPDRRKHTVTVTSEGVNVVPKPTPAEIAEVSIAIGRRSSVISLGGPSSAGSSMRPGSSTFSPSEETPDVNTPASSISTSSQDTAYSPGIFIKPHTDDDEEHGIAKDVGALVDRPMLAVSFFTPLLGSLLLNQNPVISESVRNGVVAVMGRLRGQGEISAETWGVGGQSPELDERKTFVTQDGPHQHDLRPFTAESKTMVEWELLQGIIIGMGRLATDMPDVLFDDLDTEEDIRDQEAFQLQLIQEATAGRATSMNLMGSVCEFFQPDETVDFGFVDEVLASADGDVPVRAEAAVAMSFLAKIAPVDDIYRMLPLFELFCQDENDHVKQSACLSLPTLCRRIESVDERRTFAISGVQALTSASEDVRCAALEMLGEVIYIFHDDPNGPPSELLDVYNDDSEVMPGWIDSDWDIVAMFNFPGVCLTLGPERWDDIRDLFHRLQQRAGDKVLHTTAACLHELAKILRPEQVVEDLLPVYSKLLEGSEELRERIFEHVDVIIASVPREVGWELFEHLAQSWTDNTLGGWRAREKLSVHLPELLKTFKGWHSVGKILGMMRDALLDPFAAVRDAVTRGIPDAYEVLDDDDELLKAFRQTLLDLGASRVFKQRLTFVRCLREFAKPPPNRNAFEEFFLPSLPKLAEDVVDVRLGLAQIIADLFVVGAYYGKGDEYIPKLIRTLADKLANDQAVDVRDTVRKVDLTRLAKGKGVPHEVDPVETSDRAHIPDYLHPDSPSHPNSKLGEGAEGAAADVQNPTATPSIVTRNSGATPRQEPPAPPQRRTSAEVYAKMSMMHLGVGGSGSELDNGSGEPTPKANYDHEEEEATTTRMRKEGNPFAVSFAKARPPEKEEESW